MDYGALVKESWAKVSSNLVKWALFVLVGSMLTMTMVLIPTVVRGFIKCTLEFLRTGKEPDFGELWNFEGYVPMLLLIIVAGTIIGFGSILIIPGILFGVWWMYGVFYLVDKNMDFWPALGASKEAVGQAGFFSHFLLMIIISILNSIGGMACGLGTLITAPMGMIMMAMVYLDMTGEKKIGS